MQNVFSHGLQSAASALCNACYDGDLARTVLIWQQSLAFGNVINSWDEEGLTPLHRAAYRGHLPIVRFLLSQNADPNRKGDPASQQCTPVHWAAGAGHLPIVSLLLESGGDPHLEDDYGYTAIAHAVQHGHTLVAHFIWFLNQSNINMRQVDGQTHTLVHWAAYRGHLTTLRYLVEVHNLPVNAIDSVGRSPLHWAARQGFPHICKYLLEKGSTQTRDSEDHTPLMWAESRGHDHTAQVLSVKHTAAELSSKRSPSWRTIQYFKQKEQRNKFIVGVLSVPFVTFVLCNQIPLVLVVLVCMAYFFIPLRMVLFTLSFIMPIKRDHKKATEFNSFSRFVRNLGAFGTFWGFLLTHFYLAFTTIYTNSPVTVWHNVGAMCALITTLSMIITSTSNPGIVEKNIDAVDFRSTIFAAVESRNFDEVDEKKYDMETFFRKSKRTYGCEQLDDLMIKGFDHFNIYLDSPVGYRNHRAFLLMLITLVGYLLSTLYLSVHDHIPNKLPISMNTPWMEKLLGFSLCRFVASLLDFWGALALVKKIFFIAISVATKEFFILVFCTAGLIVVLGATLVTQVVLVALNLTNWEHSKNMENMKKLEKPEKNPFHEGYFKNALLFILGRRIT